MSKSTKQPAPAWTVSVGCPDEVLKDFVHDVEALVEKHGFIAMVTAKQGKPRPSHWPPGGPRMKPKESK